MPFKNPHPLYSVWRGMRNRCRNPSFHQWRDYGGRGIAVCERWESFSNFVADMGERPPGTSIERRDNDGNYESGNCYWATKKVQQRNQRRTRRVVIDGKTFVAADLAEINGIETTTIVERVAKGLPYEAIIGVEKVIWPRPRKTHCPSGHEFTPENTYVTKEGWQNCRACKAIKQRKRYARNAAIAHGIALAASAR